MIVGTSEARAGRRPVSVMCIRGDAADADTDTRPMYGCVLTITTPRSYVGDDTGYAKHTWTLPSWDFPADVDMESARCYLNPNDVHGDSKEVHLDIYIIKLNVDHESSLNVVRCLSMWRLPCRILLYWSIAHE